MDASQRERLLYRRQYFYGPEFDEFPDWQQLRLPNGFHLAVHPDLDVTRLDGGEFTLVLLGYMLDPDFPQADNLQILHGLAQTGSTAALVPALDRLAGRYVLFVFSGKELFVLNDAGGLRQIFYYQDEKGNLWLAPQPGLISKKFKLVYSDEANHFLNSETIKKSREPWWPGSSTPFAEVHHLLPNHLLHLDTAQVERFWPKDPITRYSLKSGAEKAAELMHKIMKAANNRFKLAMALTGGFDSRIVFAACKDFLPDIHLYTMVYHHLTLQSSDVTVAEQLAKFVGQPHQVFDCHAPMDPDFEYLYIHNLEKSYQSYGNIVYGRFTHLDQDYIVVKSVVNEIARCFYFRTGVYPYQITSELLCRLSKLGSVPFVCSHFTAWMQDAQIAVEKGYRLLDLFYWENRNANWQAMSQLEFDLAHEEFTPFSNRLLLTIMLGVNDKYRHMPKNQFQRELVKASWPEIDKFPYNPDNKVIRKPFYEGPWMQVGRWIKYRVLRKNHEH